jgi:ketosteroid isomerase-like protein
MTSAAEDIRSLVDAYAVAVDTRDVELFSSVWTADAVLTVHKGDEQISSYDGAESMSRVIELISSRYRSTVHIIGAHRSVTRADGRVAVGVTSAVAHHIGPVAGGPSWDRQLGIRYVDGYRWEGGAWLIASRQCHQLWINDVAVEAW